MTRNQKIATTFLLATLTAGFLYPPMGAVMAISTFFTLVLASFGINEILKWQKTNSFKQTQDAPNTKKNNNTPSSSKSPSHPDQNKNLEPLLNLSSLLKELDIKPNLNAKNFDEFFQGFSNLSEKDWNKMNDLADAIIEQSFDNSDESWKKRRVVIELASQSKPENTDKKRQKLNPKPVFQDIPNSIPQDIPKDALLMTENAKAAGALVALSHKLKAIGIDRTTDQANTEKIIKKLSPKEHSELIDLVKKALNLAPNTKLTSKEQFYETIKNATQAFSQGKIKPKETEELGQQLLGHVRRLKGNVTENDLENTQQFMNRLREDSFIVHRINQYSAQKGYDPKEVFLTVIPLAIAEILKESVKKQDAKNEQEKNRQARLAKDKLERLQKELKLREKQPPKKAPSPSSPVDKFPFKPTLLSAREEPTIAPACPSLNRETPYVAGPNTSVKAEPLGEPTLLTISSDRPKMLGRSKPRTIPKFNFAQTTQPSDEKLAILKIQEIMVDYAEKTKTNITNLWIQDFHLFVLNELQKRKQNDMEPRVLSNEQVQAINSIQDILTNKGETPLTETILEFGSNAISKSTITNRAQLEQAMGEVVHRRMRA